jgi:site-specific recombinase XerD
MAELRLQKGCPLGKCGLAAASSPHKHLFRRDHAQRNPVVEVERPAINRDEGSTLAFAKAQAQMLDAPSEDTVAGLRDRAILSIGLQVGLRRAEIAALTVGDLHQNRGYDSLHVSRKGGRRDALAIGQPLVRPVDCAFPQDDEKGAELSAGGLD